VEQDHYISILAERIQVSTDALRQKLLHFSEQPAKKLKQTKIDTTQQPLQRERIVLEQNLLSLAFRFPHLRESLIGLPSDVFVQDNAQRLAGFLVKNPEFKGEAALLDELKDMADYVKMIILLSEELYQNTDSEELRYQTENLTHRLVTEYIKNKKQLLMQDLGSNDDKKTHEALTKVKELDELSRVYRPR
jgi:hypothetical protein